MRNIRRLNDKSPPRKEVGLVKRLAQDQNTSLHGEVPTFAGAASFV
jgi:hypothetical protein